MPRVFGLLTGLRRAGVAMFALLLLSQGARAEKCSAILAAVGPVSSDHARAVNERFLPEGHSCTKPPHLTSVCTHAFTHGFGGKLETVKFVSGTAPNRKGEITFFGQCFCEDPSLPEPPPRRIDREGREIKVVDKNSREFAEFKKKEKAKGSKLDDSQLLREFKKEIDRQPKKRLAGVTLSRRVECEE